MGHLYYNWRFIILVLFGFMLVWLFYFLWTVFVFHKRYLSMVRSLVIRLFWLCQYSHKLIHLLFGFLLFVLIVQYRWYRFFAIRIISNSLHNRNLPSLAPYPTYQCPSLIHFPFRPCQLFDSRSKILNWLHYQ